MTPSETKLPRRLIEAIQARRCVLFVGSGLSAQVRRSDGRPLPTWAALVSELLALAVAGDEPIRQAADIKQMIKKGRLPDAAQTLQEQVSGAALGAYFQLIFGDRGVQPGPLHRLIAQIPFRAVLTSNYDRLIEGAISLARNGWHPQIIVPDDLIHRAPLLNNSEFFVFKLHGDYQRMSTVVLGQRDYQRLFHRYPVYRHFLETVFATNTVVFIGYGGSDPDLDEIHNKLSNIYESAFEPNYLVLPRGRFNLAEKQRLLRDKRLAVLEYEPDAGHSQLGVMLREMAATAIFSQHSDHRRTRVLIAACSDDSSELEQLRSLLESEQYSHALFDVVARPSAAYFEELDAKLQLARYVLSLVTPRSRSNFTFVSSYADGRPLDLISLLTDGITVPKALEEFPAFRVPDSSTPGNRYSGLAATLSALDSPKSI